jgi:hypothetical protein
VRRRGLDYVTQKTFFVVPVRVVYAVGFGTNKMVCISADKTSLVACTKNSQMCNKEVRITEGGFIFIGACNAPYNRIGNAVNTTLKLPVFLFNSLLFKSTLLIYNFAFLSTGGMWKNSKQALMLKFYTSEYACIHE